MISKGGSGPQHRHSPSLFSQCFHVMISLSSHNFAQRQDIISIAIPILQMRTMRPQAMAVRAQGHPVTTWFSNSGSVAFCCHTLLWGPGQSWGLCSSCLLPYLFPVPRLPQDFSPLVLLASGLSPSNALPRPSRGQILLNSAATSAPLCSRCLGVPLCLTDATHRVRRLVGPPRPDSILPCVNLLPLQIGMPAAIQGSSG